MGRILGQLLVQKKTAQAVLKILISITITKKHMVNLYKWLSQ
jgi:hypothetical protein